MRHNRSINQLRSNERGLSGVSNISFNYSGNSAVLDKSTESIALTAAPTSSNRKQMVLYAHEQPCIKLEIKFSPRFIGIESAEISNLKSTTCIISKYC